MNFLTSTIFVVLAACALHTAIAAPGVNSCMRICNRMYLPVCGQDNSGTLRTFGNKCEFEVEECTDRAAGWRIVWEDECVAPSATRVCNQACTREYAPVCGQDNTGNLETFGNKCTFEYEECSDRAAGWRLVKHGACDETVYACTDDYRPVCGTNNFGTLTTFSNQCEFEAKQRFNRGENWRMVSTGECGGNVPPVRICPLIYAPVCAEESTGTMRTFANKCMFDAAVSRDPAMTFQYNGACKVLVEGVMSVCPLIWAPVCGEDSTATMRTFANECMFKAAATRDPGMQFIYNGECKVPVSGKAPVAVCPLIYAPVCGVSRDGTKRTYANECIFKAAAKTEAGLRLVSAGECSVPVNAGFVTACPANWAPVCGEDSTATQVTFGNMCMFEAALVRDPGMQFLYPGECKVPV